MRSFKINLTVPGLGRSTWLATSISILHQGQRGNCGGAKLGLMWLIHRLESHPEQCSFKLAWDQLITHEEEISPKGLSFTDLSKSITSGRETAMGTQAWKCLADSMAVWYPSRAHPQGCTPRPKWVMKIKKLWICWMGKKGISNKTCSLGLPPLPPKLCKPLISQMPLSEGRGNICSWLPLTPCL